MTDQETFDETAAVGMTIEAAREFFKEHGYTVRVSNKDGLATIGTRDYRTDRVNVATVDGIVTEIRGVG